MAEDTAMKKTLQLYANPQLIQASALDQIEKQVLGGEPVVDGNNVFTFTTEFNAQCTAGFASAVSRKFESLYPVRAQSFEDLYSHMSDFDYEGLYGMPANTTVELVFDRNFIINNAEAIDGDVDYRKIILPRFSTFTIGTYKFGIHYPIEIQVRMAYKQNEEGRSTGEVDFDNCIITTQWDLSTSNPLVEYASNILEHRNFVKDGINLVCISVPIYQFEITTETLDCISNTGFAKKFDFKDKFYICRVYHKLDNVWYEMSQTYSSIVYDPDVATAMIRVYPDRNQLSVEIPQIYFSKRLIGNQVRVEIYTTLGALNVDISTYTSDQYEASFLLDDDRVSDSKYSNMLKYVSVCRVLPLSTLISSGRNGLTFEQLKDRVVNNTAKSLLITADKIAAHLKDKGFNAKSYVDNITDRKYLAEKVLADNEGTIVSAGSFNTIFSSKDLTSKYNETEEVTQFVNHDTFRYIDTNTFVVLPNTIYKYDKDTDSAVPMDNEWMAEYNNMSGEEKVNLLNSGIYSFSPFHLKVTIDNTTPVAAYYDMLNPKISNTKFLDENSKTNTQISIYSSRITHKEDMTGYTLDIMLYQTDDIVDLPVVNKDNPNADNIYCLLRVAMTDGNYTYAFGKPSGRINNHNVISFNLATDYAIDGNDQLILNSFTTVGASSKVKLTDNYELMFFIQPEYAKSGIGPRPANIPEFLNSLVWLATQQITIKLGEPIDNLLTSMYMEAESEELASYPTTTFSTYNNDTYARYTEADVGSIVNGVKITSDKIGTVKFPLQVVHYAGEVIISNDGVNTKGITLTINTVTDEGSDNSVYALKGIYTSNATPFNVFESVVVDPLDHNNQKLITLTESNIGQYVGQQYIQLDKYGTIINSDIGKTVLISTGKHLSTEDIVEVIYEEISNTEPFNEVDELKTIVTSTGVSNAGTGRVFIMVKDASRDSSSPECEIKGIGTGGAVYRRMTDVNLESYKELKYVDSNGNTQYFTESELFAFFMSLDTASASRSSIIEDWGINSETYERLQKIRFPYIKVFELYGDDSDPVEYGITKLKAYLDELSFVKIWDEDSNSEIDSEIPTKDLRNIQSLLYNPMVSYSTLEEAENNRESIPYGYVVYAQNLNDAEVLGIFKDLEVKDNETKGALGIIEEQIIDSASRKAIKWIICGPSSSACRSAVLSYNTYHGFIQTLRDENNVITHYRLLSYTKDNKLDINLGSVNWTVVYQWPWEIDTKWISKETSMQTNSVSCFLNDGSVVIGQQAGAAKYENGTLLTNIVSDKGNYIPIDAATESTRKVTYNVRMLHADYKLLLSEETEHTTYRSDIITKIRTYFETIEETKLRLLEGTDLYYSPIRTMGYAKFKGNMGNMLYSDLNITIGFRLHVESYITANTSTKDIIRNNILKIVDKHIATGTISLTAIAAEIQESMSDMIIHVDVLGINDDVNVQTLLRADSSTIPHLGYRLVIGNDRVIRVERSLTLEYSIVS